jgi:predicted AlkP superfamily phosphohydrolase/phosphomutase
MTGLRKFHCGKWLAASVILLFFQLACTRESSNPAHKRVIVLGFDAMDPNFLERHWKDLPNLDWLRRNGEFKRLGSSIPPQSPVAWSTFTTGMDPGGHGIFDFVHRDPKTMSLLSSMAETEAPEKTLSIGPYLIPISKGKVRSFRKGVAFWQLLDQRGIPVTVLRMPNNFPPVPCKGKTLSGMGTPDLYGTYGTFALYTDVPEVVTHEVSGGRIIRVGLTNHHVTLVVEGPENTLRKDKRRASVSVAVDVDPAAPVALFRVGETELILKQGEWSDWIRVKFPLIQGLKSTAGMFRIYAKTLHPRFEVYISPINIDPFDPALPISTPDSYSRELAEAVGPYSTQGIGEDTAALREGVFSRAIYRQQSRMVSEEHLRVLFHALDECKEGMLFFHFFGIDQDSHVLWGAYEDELLETYKLADEALGKVMKRIGDGTLIVMSDHGFARFDRAVNLNTWLWREGFMSLDDPDNASNEELFPHVDWARTQAYSLGLNAIYVNQLGRERYGVIEPGEETKEVAARIAERLRGFRDPANGKPVVQNVYVASEVYHGEAAASAPDLIVGWAPGYRSSWQTALGAVPKTLIEDNKDEWRGDHCMATESVPGVFLSNRKCRLDDPKLQDVTVTILAQFGVQPAKGMTGRVLF